jgi:hypothetical protein
MEGRAQTRSRLCTLGRFNFIPRTYLLPHEAADAMDDWNHSRCPPTPRPRQHGRDHVHALGRAHTRAHAPSYALGAIGFGSLIGVGYTQS